MDRYAAVREQLADQWIPAIYAARVRSQRTRSHELDIAPRENAASIQYTLLGIELKVGKRRFACPDLATARYIRVFARVGCSNFAIPYDITTISVIADELETSWQKMLLVIDGNAGELSASGRSRFRRTVLATLRDELDQIGAGPQMPEFTRSTRQR